MAGKLVGIASLDMPGATAAELLTELTAAIPSTSATGATAQKGGSAVPLKFEGQDGSMAAAGYLLAQAATGGSPHSLCASDYLTELKVCLIQWMRSAAHRQTRLPSHDSKFYLSTMEANGVWQCSWQFLWLTC